MNSIQESLIANSHLTIATPISKIADQENGLETNYIPDLNFDNRPDPRRAVCKITYQSFNGEPQSGTGFLTKLTRNDRTSYGILTAAHILVSYDDKKTLTISYEGINPPEKIDILQSPYSKLSIRLDYAIDIAIIDVIESDVPKMMREGHIFLETAHFILHDDIRVMGHPNGGLLKEANGKILKQPYNQYIHHSASTEGGSSGSPVLNQFNQVVGIHIRGNEIEQYNVAAIIECAYILVFGKISLSFDDIGMIAIQVQETYWQKNIERLEGCLENNERKKHLFDLIQRKIGYISKKNQERVWFLNTDFAWYFTFDDILNTKVKPNWMLVVKDINVDTIPDWNTKESWCLAIIKIMKSLQE